MIAMPVSPRLYVADDLPGDGRITLAHVQSHYLVHVLRRAAGDEVRLFNGRDGEWRGVIARLGKKSVDLVLADCLRPQTAGPDLALLFAPVKKARTDFIVEKATELGVRILAPVITARTNAETVRIERLAALAIEAAEQTERLDVPSIAAPLKLEHALSTWPRERLVVFADEAGDDQSAAWGGTAGRAPALASVLADIAPTTPLAFLVGPEGGFTPDERASLRALPFVRPAGLGPRILRADTAAAAGLAVIGALWGDWRV